MEAKGCEHVRPSAAASTIRLRFVEPSVVAEGLNVAVTRLLSVVALNVTGLDATIQLSVTVTSPESPGGIQDFRSERETVNSDAEFVTVEEDDETIRIFRKGSRVFVNVDGRRGEKVRVELPIALVDALLSGDSDDELDMAAAMAELQKMGSGEIVRVEDGKDTVRIWID